MDIEAVSHVLGSGALKSENITLEYRIDVAPKISNGVLFDLKYEIFILDILSWFLSFVNIYLLYNSLFRSLLISSRQQRKPLLFQQAESLRGYYLASQGLFQ